MMQPQNGREPLVLVVEDDATLRHLIANALRQDGFAVVEAENGEDGEAKLWALHPKIMILDIMLPDKNGIDICMEARENPDLASTRILVMTCLTEKSEQADEEWRDKIKADDFMTKPFSVTELLKRVRALLT